MPHAQRLPDSPAETTPTLVQPAPPITPCATLTTAEAANYLGIALSSLGRLRMIGGGPDYVKLSDSPRGRVVYTREALQEFLRRRTRVSVPASSAT